VKQGTGAVRRSIL